METLKRSVRFQLIETKNFLLGFWITMIIVNILFYFMNGANFVNFDIGFMLGNSEGDFLSVAGVNLMAIVIAMIAHSYDRKYQDFSLSQSLSMTRSNYFKSLLVSNVLIAFASAVIQGVLLKIDPIIMSKIGKKPIYDFINFNIKTDNIIFIIFSLFILFLALAAFTNLLTSLNYKFGYMMWIVIAAITMIFIITGTGIHLIDNIINKIGSVLFARYGIYEILMILVGLAVMYLVNFIITINTDIKKKSL